ncbi:MAG: hypothetical protein DRJ68_06350, partial [Thermoprotei archaeon]
MPLSIDELARRFQEGVRGSGPKWESRTIAGVNRYREGFAPVYSAQIACAEAVKRQGLGGYDALL